MLSASKLGSSIETSELSDGAVTNAKVSATAAIVYSKLNLTGSIVAADMAAGSQDWEFVSLTTTGADAANVDISSLDTDTYTYFVEFAILTNGAPQWFGLQANSEGVNNSNWKFCKLQLDTVPSSTRDSANCIITPQDTLAADYANCSFILGRHVKYPFIYAQAHTIISGGTSSGASITIGRRNIDANITTIRIASSSGDVDAIKTGSKFALYRKVKT